MNYEDNTCPTCAGMGQAVKNIKRVQRGSVMRVKSVTFDLTKSCPDCDGTGEARAKEKAA